MDPLTLAEIPPSMLRVLAVVFGLLWGSFTNVVIHRVPRAMSLVRPASHCPACGEPIRAYLNVPVFGWLLLRGKARCCGAPISPRYPLVEAIGGLLSLAVLEAIVLQLPGSTPAVHALAIYLLDFALGLALTAAAFIDLEFMLVPDSISLGGTIVGLLTFGLRQMQVEDALLGAAVGFVVLWLPFDWLYTKLTGAPGMGRGDAKLLMLAGAWFGWPGALLTVGAAAIQGTLAAGLMWLWQGRIDEPDAVRREREQIQAEIDALPESERAAAQEEWARDPLAAPPQSGVGKARVAFGPFLALATLELLLLDRDRIMDWLFS
jgi:leader peptidase (prepilin peptidase)/N-methyltransferase